MAADSYLKPLFVELALGESRIFINADEISRIIPVPATPDKYNVILKGNDDSRFVCVWSMSKEDFAKLVGRKAK